MKKERSGGKETRHQQQPENVLLDAFQLVDDLIGLLTGHGGGSIIWVRLSGGVRGCFGCCSLSSWYGISLV